MSTQIPRIIVQENKIQRVNNWWDGARPSSSAQAFGNEMTVTPTADRLHKSAAVRRPERPSSTPFSVADRRQRETIDELREQALREQVC